MKPQPLTTRIALFTFLFCFGLSSNARAVEDEAPRAFHEADWFFYVSTGIGRPDYDQNIQSRIDLQKSLGGTSPSAGFFDIPGIYRRLGTDWAAGFVLNAHFEHVAKEWREQNSFAIHTLNPAASVLYFPFGTFGEGAFVRGDLGATRIMQVRETYDPTIPLLKFERLNSDGYFMQAGAGYAWKAGRVSRLLVHANAFRSSADTHTVDGLAVYMGFLL